MKSYYTYVYLDPRKSGSFACGDYTFEYEPFYVGKGKLNQYLSHIQQANNHDKVPVGNNTHKFYKIKNILNENLEPIILKVEENLSEQEAFDLETWTIWAIGRSDLKSGPLTNLIDGGTGGNNPSTETRLKHSVALKGRSKTEEHKKKLSEAIKGKKHSEETRQKMSQSRKGKNHPMFGKHHSEETKIKQSGVKKGKASPRRGKKNIYSKETIQKMIDSHKGQIPWNKGKKTGPHSGESNKKRSEALKGKPKRKRVVYENN